MLNNMVAQLRVLTPPRGRWRSLALVLPHPPRVDISWLGLPQDDGALLPRIVTIRIFQLGHLLHHLSHGSSERDLVLSVHPVVAVLLLPVLELLLLLLDLKLLLVVQQLSLRFVLLVE